MSYNFSVNINHELFVRYNSKNKNIDKHWWGIFWNEIILLKCLTWNSIIIKMCLKNLSVCVGIHLQLTRLRRFGILNIIENIFYIMLIENGGINLVYYKLLAMFHLNNNTCSYYIIIALLYTWISGFEKEQKHRKWFLFQNCIMRIPDTL